MAIAKASCYLWAQMEFCPHFLQFLVQSGYNSVMQMQTKIYWTATFVKIGAVTIILIRCSDNHTYNVQIMNFHPYFLHLTVNVGDIQYESSAHNGV
jgi:hypothetical protein